MCRRSEAGVNPTGLPLGPKSPRLFSEDHEGRGFGERLLLAGQFPLQLLDPFISVLGFPRDLARRRLVCLPESGPVFELVPAPIMELRHGQESQA